MGDYIGEGSRVIKANTRSLDYTSYCEWVLGLKF